MKPLFIPLKREFFVAFEAGDKTEEFRPYGPRWNERTCAIGRPVVISLGYGVKRRRSGTVTGFRVDHNPHARPGWTACYAGSTKSAACIQIALDPLPLSACTL